MRKIAFATMLALVYLSAPAQPVSVGGWTLDECINYAMKHNSEIILMELDAEIASTKLHTSKMSGLPDLNASLGENLSFGNYNASTGSLDGTPSSANRNLSYTTGSVETSLPVFSGLKIHYQIQADKFGLEAALCDLQQAGLDIGIKVAVKYLECLYCKSMTNIASERVILSEKLLEKAEILYDEGVRPLSERFEAEARLAKANAELVESKGKTNLALEDLAGLLMLNDVHGFDICDDLPEEYSAPVMYEADSLDNLPAVRAQRFRLLMNESLVKTEKAALYPSLSFLGAVRTFSVKSFYYDLGWGSFGEQFFKNNMNYVIGLNLTIPIYNRSQTRDRIRIAEYQTRKQAQALEQSRTMKKREIHTAYTNMMNSYERLCSAKKSAEASGTSYDYAVVRYDSHSCTITDVLQAQQNLMEEKQREAQALYEYMIYKRIYRYYVSK